MLRAPGLAGTCVKSRRHALRLRAEDLVLGAQGEGHRRLTALGCSFWSINSHRRAFWSLCSSVTPQCHCTPWTHNELFNEWTEFWGFFSELEKLGACWDVSPRYRNYNLEVYQPYPAIPHPIPHTVPYRKFIRWRREAVPIRGESGGEW